MGEIRKEDGTPFGNKGSLVMALQRQELTDTYEMVEKEGGWVGVKKTECPPKETKPQKPKVTKCRVHRSNCDPDNRDMQISVTVNNAANKKVFWPGQEVELTDSQLGVLRDSVEEVKLVIPPESAVYSAKDPVAVARGYYPNMTAEVASATGIISMVSRIPNFIVEAVI